MEKEIIEKNLTLDLYAKRICEMDEEINIGYVIPEEAILPK